MAKDSEKEISKEKEKEKRENRKKALRAAAAKKPKRSPIKFFKEARAEFRKVTWPTPKQVVNNTGVVLISIVTTSLVIYGLDSLFAAILSFIYNVKLGA